MADYEDHKPAVGPSTPEADGSPDTQRTHETETQQAQRDEEIQNTSKGHTDQPDEWETFEDVDLGHAETRTTFSDDVQDVQDVSPEDDGATADLNSVAAVPSIQIVEASEPREPTEEQLDAVQSVLRREPGDSYLILGLLSDQRTWDDVKKAYKRLSLLTHPDKNPAPGAEEAFKRVSNAYEQLHDTYNKPFKDEHLGPREQSADEETSAEPTEEQINADTSNLTEEQRAAVKYVLKGSPRAYFRILGLNAKTCTYQDIDRQYSRLYGLTCVDSDPARAAAKACARVQQAYRALKRSYLPGPARYSYAPKTPFWARKVPPEWDITFWSRPFEDIQDPNRSYGWSNNESYWELDQYGRTWLDEANAPIPHFAPKGTMNRKHHRIKLPDSRLRHSKSVDDLSSPETSPENDQFGVLKGFASVLRRSKSAQKLGGPAALDQTQARSSSLYEPKSGQSWADHDPDEEEDLSDVLAEFCNTSTSSAPANERRTERTQSPEAEQSEHLEETGIQRSPQNGAGAETGDTTVIGAADNEAAQPVDAEFPEHPGVDAAFENAENKRPDEAEIGEAADCRDNRDSGDNALGSSSSAVPDHDAPEPTHSGDDVAGAEGVSRHDKDDVGDGEQLGASEESASEKETAEDVQEQEDLDDQTPETSPTSVSSEDSTTGMTQREGMQKAKQYLDDPKPSLPKARAMFKDQYPKLFTKAFPGDHEARNELLEAKVHKLKHALNCAMDARDSALDARDSAMNARDRALDELKVVRQNFDQASQQRDKARADYEHAAETHNGNVAGYLAQKEEMESLQEQLQQAEQKHAKLKSLAQHYANAFDELEDKYDKEKAQWEQASTADAQKVDETKTEVESDNQSFAAQPPAMVGPATTLLAPTTVRWPADIIESLAEHVAEWVNHTHADETSREVEALTPATVRDILGDGTISFFDLDAQLRQAGYAFRRDRFGQDIAEFMQLNGLSSIEAMSAQRHLNDTYDAVVQLLQEVNDLQSQATEHTSSAERMEEQYQSLNDELSTMRQQLDEYDSDSGLNEKLRDDLQQCHEHGAELTKANSELNDELDALKKDLAELTTKLAFKSQQLDEHYARSDEIEAERDNLKAQLARGCERCPPLETALANLKQEYASLEKELKKSEARNADLTRENDDLSQQLDKYKDQYEAVTDRKAQFMAEIKELKKQQVSHFRMLKLAHDTIEEQRTLVKASTATAAPTAPITSPQNDQLPPPLPSDIAAEFAALRTPRSGRVTHADQRGQERLAKIRNSEAYQQAAEAQRIAREDEKRLRREKWDLRRAAYENLCGWTEIPHIPKEEREASLRRLAAK